MASETISLLLEGESGCLMCRLPAVSDCARVTDWAHENIAETDLAKDGFENDVHFTVAYGFTPDVTPEEVSTFITNYAPDGINIRLGAMSFFDTDPEHDVLKIEIESEELEQMHYELRQAFSKRLVTTFPVFHGHVTIAYVKKGRCRNFEGNASFAGWAFKIDKFTYSTPGMKSNWTLPLEKPAVVREAPPMKPTTESLLEAANFHPDILDELHAFENGELNEKQTIAMFKKMVKQGMKLTGPYGRMAQNLIRKGLIDPPKEKKSESIEVLGKRMATRLLEDESEDEMDDTFAGDVDDQADAYADMRSDFESGDCYRIIDVVRGGYDLVGPDRRRRVAHYADFDAAVKQMVYWANADQYWPNVYAISDHGNVTPLIVNWGDGSYRMGEGWV